ncbi:hypothetical protein HU200_016126 [Digitaria exilis]|uniref:Glycosyltransferase n=1 Tax=Digitaria exilis TaxID=1010633 RepID=A0A835F8X5_9POAL|nr:hypothetical protein HU200_016126 [Digitaria exilis]
MAETTQEASSSPPLHIAVFPWLAFGHMIPFLELSKRLARRGHAVTFVSTPRNAARLRAVPPELSVRLRVVTLDLPVVEGLPEGAESTADVSPEKVPLLKAAFDCLAAPFSALVGERGGGEADGVFDRKPDWIIYDLVHIWAWSIAEEHKIPCAMFLILPAALLAYVGPKHENEAHPRRTTEDFMAQPPWIPFPTTTIFHLRHEAMSRASEFQRNASGVADIDRLWKVHHHSCRLIIHRSCPEAEPWLFPLLSDLFSKPVVPSGLLLPTDIAAGDVTGDDEPFEAAARWLDGQPRRSVVYVALGTEAPVKAEHIVELARGLELSGVRFLWAFRTPAIAAGELLPDGFEHRVSGRGVVVTGWVPQVRVLAQVTVGAFVTHCGWGSTVESLFMFGHPLVMLPFVFDQGLIARAMAVRGVGVEVARDGDGSFSGEDVAAAVRRVMVEEEGEELARNAKELQRVVGDRVRDEQYVDELVEYLQRYK